MTDYRLKPNRRAYFDALYSMLMRLARKAQEQGCWATAEVLLRELGRRGASALRDAA